MFRDLVIKTRSYRRFDESFVITRDVLKDLVDLARQTASAANKQPLKYFLSCDPETNAAIFDMLAWAAYLPDWNGPSNGERPSAYIIMLGDKDVSQTFDYDNGIAAQTILLGAVEKDLGGCMFLNVQRAKFREKFDIPKKYDILVAIALGKPVETVILEPMKPDGDVKYWRDQEGRHHVPKRSLADIIVN